MYIEIKKPEKRKKAETPINTSVSAFLFEVLKICMKIETYKVAKTC